jgi:hypothetical protein
MPLVQETDDAYHNPPEFTGWSKTKLWGYDQYTPYRAEFGAFKEKDYLLFGRAGHVAVLEPDQLESRVHKSDVADRRGKKWDDAKEEAGDRICLLPQEWDMLMMMRDLADENEWIRKMREGKPIIETSCYAVDPETGAKIKCRVDQYSPEYGGILDLKFLAGIDDDSWSRDLGQYGYMMQDAFYNHVWNLGSGYESEFMIFACFAKTEPPEMIVRQLDPIDVQEGALRFKAALEVAERCRIEQHWPGQPTEIVSTVKMQDKHRKFTPPQWRRDEAEETDDVVAD